MLRAINNSIANALGGKSFEKSFREMLDYKPETRTGDEIKSDMLKKLHALGN